MTRRARPRLDGVPWHVVQRGNNRNRCFFQEADYRLYLGLLEELSPQHACRIHAYVLMTNHVHLLLTPGTARGASLLMKHLGQRYVQYVNRTHKRTGSLWEGRFRSSVVDSEIYLLQCQRYIELNPVRAGMVRHPGEYRWSSYATNANGKPSSLIAPHPQYIALGTSNEDRLANYQALFKGQVPEAQLEEIRSALKSGLALGQTGV